MKNSLQRELEQRTNEFLTMKELTNSLIDHVKEQTEKISLEKVIPSMRFHVKIS
jgi:hypothetical protein